LLVSYARARAEAAGTKMETVGIAERAERIIILTIASIVAAFWQPVTVIGVAMLLLAVLTNVTVLQRAVYAYRVLRKERKD
jgi:phosphatidylglycerophosphate synthase